MSHCLICGCEAGKIEIFFTCPGCGHRWHEHSLPASHYADQAGRNAGLPHFAAKLEARLLSLRPYLRTGQRILEIGCAEGALGALVKASCAVRYDGVELSEDAISAAQVLDQVSRQPANMLVDNEKYDLVISFHVLEHLADPVRELQDWHALLQHDGRLIVEVPNGSGHPDIEIDRHPEHLHQFTPASLTLTLAQAGFEIRRLETGHIESPFYRDCLWAEAVLARSAQHRRDALLSRFRQKMGEAFVVYGVGGDFLNYVAPWLNVLPVLALCDSAQHRHGERFGNHIVRPFKPDNWPKVPILIASSRHGASIRQDLIDAGVAAGRLILLEDLYG